MSVPAYDEVEEGAALPSLTIRVTRADLVRYAGASGDFNPIHWSGSAARDAGLPDVIAHGMVTMAQAARVVTTWVTDPARVVDYSVRFTDSVAVPDIAEGTELTCTGTVAKKLGDGTVRVDLTATCGDTKVLGAARAVVRLD